MNMFTYTSVSYTPDGNEPFVATMESPAYPFYAVQFHPEKTLTMFRDGDPATRPVHTLGGEKMNRYFADFFVSQARLNTNNPGDFATVQSKIIANYDMLVTTSSYGNVYVFN